MSLDIIHKLTQNSLYQGYVQESQIGLVDDLFSRVLQVVDNSDMNQNYREKLLRIRHLSKTNYKAIDLTKLTKCYGQKFEVTIKP